MRTLKNNRPAKQTSLEIFNSEGPILQAVKIGDYFVMVDEDQEQVDVLKANDMLRFLEGERTVEDSRGRLWNYPIVDRGMKTEKSKILAFVDLFYEIDAVKLIEACVEEHGLEKIDPEMVILVAEVIGKNPNLILKK